MLWLSYIQKKKMKFVLFLCGRWLKMNKNSTLIISDNDFDEYPEITQAELDKAIHRRGFAEAPKKQSVNLTLDSDIIAWFKKKSGENEYQTLINTTLREIVTRNL